MEPRQIKFKGKRKFLRQMRKKYDNPNMTFNEAIDKLQINCEPRLMTPYNQIATNK